MTRLKFLFDEEEEKEEESKPGWEQRIRGIGELPKYEIPEPTKLKFTAGIGLGLGAKAGVPLAKPVEEPSPLFQDPKMMELHKINFESFKLWFRELKESKDKIAFLKGEGQSPDLIELRKRYNELAPHMFAKGEQWIENVSMISVGIGMAWQLVNAAVTSGFKVKGKVISAEELKGVLARARAAYITETGKFKATLSDNDFAIMKQLNVFFKTSGRGTAAREMLEKIVERTGGLSFPQQVNIFGGRLYAGLPADEIVKSLIKAGKVTADIARELSLAKPELVSQVWQNLSVASPAIAAKLGPELAKLIPEVEPTKPVIEKPKDELIIDKLYVKGDKGLVKEFFNDFKSDIVTGKITTGGKLASETYKKYGNEFYVNLTYALGQDKFIQEMQKKGEIPTPKIIHEKTFGKALEIIKEGKPEIPKVEPIIEKPVPKPEVKPEVEVKPEIGMATPKQIKKAHAIANSKAMISPKGKMKPQYRSLAKAFTGKTSIKKMTEDEAEIFIDSLNRLPEPRIGKKGELIPPTIPRTTKLVLQDFFKRKYREPTPLRYLTPQTYYAEMLGIKPLVEPYEIGKQKFDLEFRDSSKTADRIINKLNKIAETPAGEKLKSVLKNIPTKAESNMAELVDKYEEAPVKLEQGLKDVFNWFRSLSRDLINRENEVRESVDLPPIKYRKAYFRHTADGMAREMLEGKYPFPQNLKYWAEKMVGKKIFNPMEFQRKLSDDLVDLWSKDLRAVTRSMLWYGLKEIHLAQPAKFLSEQLNAISKDLPIYKNLSAEDKKAYDETRAMPASTKKWLVDYVNQVMKGQETETDAGLNRLVTQTGLKGLFNKVLSPFGRSIGRKPITHLFQFGGRVTISGVMGWVPRQIIRNLFQFVQDLALYGVKATLKSFLPASIDKNLKGLLSESLFLKSYTGFEELPTNLMGKLEKIWLGPYGVVAIFNAAKGMKASYWSTLNLVKNPKYFGTEYSMADPSRTKDTPRDYLFPSEKEKLLKEMEYGAGATQYQYIPMGMPEVFRHKALVPLTRLQSWWMNYFTKFTREAIYRGIKGETGYGQKLPWSYRVNYLKYVILGGAILVSLGYRRSFLIGVLPTYISPAGQVALGLYNYATATSDWQRQRAKRQIQYSWTAFIPGSLAWRDFIAVWNGEKDLKDLFFYKKIEKEEKKKVPLKITIPESKKLKFIEPKIEKSKKLKFTF
ncbi:hypothetical protein ES695_18170 [Candidatus Atribacteria bacterium 1244-E10-H5-B2]|nr:MAG: hypothetical protein ES695_18170 [Candidatus Atribacteria bacterium 1244-E10-H5-B2]